MPKTKCAYQRLPESEGPLCTMGTESRVGVEMNGTGDLNGVSKSEAITMDGKNTNIEDEKMEDTSKRDRTSRVFLQMMACVFAGIVFGLALEKSRVFEPESIRGQMVFRRWIMLKMFLGAVASGQLILAILSLLPVTRENFNDAADAYVGCFQEKGLVTSAIGAFMLGAGMTVSGACPGMVLAQVGSWTKNAIFTFIGVLIGALLYGLVAPYIVKFTRPKTPFENQTVHKKFNVHYAVIAIPMAIVLSVVVFLLEWFIPWQNDLDVSRRNPPGVNIIRAISWPPSVAGLLIGLLQAVIVLGVGDTLGGSSSYVTLVSQWVVTKGLQEKLPYLARARLGVGNWWQVVYVASAIVGALGASLSSDTLSTTRGVSIGAAIGGGILLVIGARFAAGCTSVITSFASATRRPVAQHRAPTFTKYRLTAKEQTNKREPVVLFSFTMTRCGVNQCGKIHGKRAARAFFQKHCICIGNSGLLRRTVSTSEQNGVNPTWLRSMERTQGNGHLQGHAVPGNPVLTTVLAVDYDDRLTAHDRAVTTVVTSPQRNHGDASQNGGVSTNISLENGINGHVQHGIVSSETKILNTSPTKPEADDTFHTLKQTTVRPVSLVFLQMATCVTAGIIFGVAIVKSRVAEPEAVRGQMVFKRWIMMKLFLSALATGQLVFALLTLLPTTRDSMNQALDEFVCCMHGKGVFTGIVGALVHGIGITISGACAGSVYIQVGTWVNNAIFTLVGCLIGALLYGFMSPYISKFTHRDKPLTAKPRVTDTFGIPYAALAIPVAAVTGVAVFLLEWYIPWREDLNPMRRNLPGANIMRAYSWPPSVSGAILGLLQGMMVLGLNDTLGGSSSYVTLVSPWVATKKLKRMFPYFAAYRAGVRNWWQLMFLGSATIGAYLMVLADETVATTYGVSIPSAIVGGILLVVGARCSSGCTSGHGLSGMGLFVWLALIAVPFMFAGGIGTAFAMRATGALCDWRYHPGGLRSNYSLCD